jgi:hypothetical protein
VSDPRWNETHTLYDRATEIELRVMYVTNTGWGWDALSTAYDPERDVIQVGNGGFATPEEARLDAEAWLAKRADLDLNDQVKSAPGERA